MMDLRRGAYGIYRNRNIFEDAYLPIEQLQIQRKGKERMNT